MLIHRHKQRAFTLIELLIGIAVLAILVTTALPNFSAWIQNMQIRGTAESILNGLQLAKANAVKSNQNTEFLLTTATPDAANVGATPSTVGKNWIVRTFRGNPYTPLVPLPAEPDFVQGRVGTEGSKNATVSTTQASFVFTPLGQMVSSTLVAPINSVEIQVGSINTYSGKRTMRVVVSPGGQILMCDPNGPAGTSPQFC